MTEEQKIKRRQYYQNNKYRICYNKINISCFKAIERDKIRAERKAEVLYERYTYHSFQKYFEIVIRTYKIYEGKYAWQECNDAASAAYVYSIYRCAAEDYSHVENYIKKVGRIFIMCAVIVASHDMKRASLDEKFERQHNKRRF